ncbi:hypothetical protein CRYUN_Cryun08bG0067300 [Craigia yunnanensis]
MVEMYPKPSIVEFTRLLGAIVRMKRFALLGIHPNVETFNSLINGLCAQVKVAQAKAVRLLRKMEERGFQPDVVAYSSHIQPLGAVSEAEDIVDTVIKQGIEPDIVTYSALIDVIVCKAKCMKLEEYML